MVRGRQEGKDILRRPFGNNVSSQAYEIFCRRHH
jgi:hypothetical protein